MENQDQDSKQEQLVEHSLPGTNQAGKGAKNDHERKPAGRTENRHELEEHSLPGTNQAGKGPR